MSYHALYPVTDKTCTDDAAPAATEKEYPDMRWRKSLKVEKTSSDETPEGFGLPAPGKTKRQVEKEIKEIISTAEADGLQVYRSPFGPVTIGTRNNVRGAKLADRRTRRQAARQGVREGTTEIRDGQRRVALALYGHRLECPDAVLRFHAGAFHASCKTHGLTAL